MSCVPSVRKIWSKGYLYRPMHNNKENKGQTDNSESEAEDLPTLLVERGRRVGQAGGARRAGRVGRAHDVVNGLQDIWIKSLRNR